MAQKENKVFAWLRANGVDLKGDATVTSGGRADSTECDYFHFGATRAIDRGTARATGRSNVEPMIFRGFIQQNLPLLYQALFNNEEMEVDAKFYRPDDAGLETHYQTIYGLKGRILSLKCYSPERSDEEGVGAVHDMFEVSIVFANVRVVNEVAGVEAEFSWAEGGA